ncbi:NADH-quinone oxidoreductase subunit C [bacterium]|nr:NADH-quinone oxidoreductase subunit C [bacterium]
MIDVSILKEKFNFNIADNKVIVESNIIDVLEYLKNTPEYKFDILTSVAAVDLKDKIELIYQLYSTGNNFTLNVSVIAENSFAKSVIDVYKSAYFDECEIYDMFGVKFEGNTNLKRLFMPESWIGHPMLKSYELKDERLVWNEK